MTVNEEAACLDSAEPLATELLAQRTVLFAEVLDGILLLLAQAAREGNQQRPEGQGEIRECGAHSAQACVRTAGRQLNGSLSTCQ